MNLKLLIVGCGLRAEYVLRELVAQDNDLTVAAVVDTDPAGARARLAKAYHGPEPRFFDTLDGALAFGPYDGALLATRCNLHAAYAAALLHAGLPVFLEKPVGICEEDLTLLESVLRETTPRVVCSFPLRAAPIAGLAREMVESGKLGDIEQAQLVNNVPYGGVYFHGWYRDERVTGGLWLQKATHDLDCLFYLLGETPAAVCAMESRRVFHGDKPAGLRCADCTENRVCPESPHVLTAERMEDVQGEYCCFAEDTGNHDAGSAIFRFASGTHAVYTQNFVVRKGAKQRGVRLIGYRGTLAFDWYENTLVFHSHMTPKVEHHCVDTAGLHHFGGDRALACNFLAVIAGGASIAPLEAGIASARACLGAKRSCETGGFVSLERFSP